MYRSILQANRVITSQSFHDIPKKFSHSCNQWNFQECQYTTRLKISWILHVNWSYSDDITSWKKLVDKRCCCGQREHVWERFASKTTLTNKLWCNFNIFPLNTCICRLYTCKHKRCLLDACDCYSAQRLKRLHLLPVQVVSLAALFRKDVSDLSHPKRHTYIICHSDEWKYSYHCLHFTAARNVLTYSKVTVFPWPLSPRPLCVRRQSERVLLRSSLVCCCTTTDVFRSLLFTGSFVLCFMEKDSAMNASA